MVVTADHGGRRGGHGGSDCGGGVRGITTGGPSALDAFGGDRSGSGAAQLDELAAGLGGDGAASVRQRSSVNEASNTTLSPRSSATVARSSIVS
jgi:hypothetical protein